IAPRMPEAIFKTKTISYSFAASIPAGIKLGISKLSGYVSDMKYIFTKEGVENLGGFGSIGKQFDYEWNWVQFWYTTAFLSVILAFMNILPIPGLDGGHLLFLLFEIITRRKPNEKFLEKAQAIGMIFLLFLILYVNINDLVNFIF
ncbi:MAG: site-2 protease family protein, partial [Paludibacteraceae bacterium]|nr:site-2 protease family protein [Paludibacteraceae bacterium]